MMTNGDDNGRVTMAVLSAKLDAIHEDLQALCGRIGRIEDQTHANTRRIDVLGERQSIFAIGQSGVSLVLSAVAAFIGSKLR